MNNIRQRIRKTGINCLPWRYYKGEIEILPISAQTLFKGDGIPIDKWEDILKEEGYLFPDEVLLDVIKDEKNLYRGILSEIGETEDINFGLIPNDFTEEDYEYRKFPL